MGPLCLILAVATHAQTAVSSVVCVGVEDLGQVGLMRRARVGVANTDPQFAVHKVRLRVVATSATREVDAGIVEFGALIEPNKSAYQEVRFPLSADFGPSRFEITPISAVYVFRPPKL